MPGRPTIWIIVGQGPTALAVGAGWGCLDIFILIYPFSPLSPSLWETARLRLKYCLKGPLNPNQPTNQLIVAFVMDLTTEGIDQTAFESAVYEYIIQYNFNGSNNDGLFTTAVSNSFTIVSISFYILRNGLVCVLIRIASNEAILRRTHNIVSC